MKLVMLSIIFLSCVNMPTVRDTDQVVPFYEYIEIDGKLYIDVEKSACLVRKYRFSKDYVGPVSAVVEVPIEECNKVVGWNPQDYADLTVYWESVRKELNKQILRCRK